MKKIALALKKAVAVLVAAAFAVTATPAHAGGNGAAVVAVGVGVGLIVCYASGYCAPAKKPTEAEWKAAPGKIEHGRNPDGSIASEEETTGCIWKTDRNGSYQDCTGGSSTKVASAPAREEMCQITNQATGKSATIPCSALQVR